MPLVRKSSPGARSIESDDALGMTKAISKPEGSRSPCTLRQPIETMVDNGRKGGQAFALHKFCSSRLCFSEPSS
ncbi:hypothetical protein Rvan_0281 [Rhodomicrobium vannielii ATCC 17100]|uniref:Uncharacterized protein n=1 Tax=Rhodomicrobium vannielii (strain ATCC 17100 / DSM 162 / LMG 4299 / NCIMB 10020 / ATH 3.1.1) TaxID=648757 RepID=E3I705_RHOVT|nr:hypothetical protein Rvan_0281 [Rhodomicrobium vannielii ATCC 17100]